MISGIHVGEQITEILLKVFDHKENIHICLVNRDGFCLYVLGILNKKTGIFKRNKFIKEDIKNIQSLLNIEVEIEGFYYYIKAI